MDRTNVNRKAFKTIDMVYIAVGAVLISVCSWISIPTLIPFTMQTFGVFCVLSALGGKRGTTAIILYLAIGAVGVPVFANFSAGLSAFLDSTGGYLIGFIFTGLVFWLAESVLGRKLWVEIASLIVGLLVCYAFGSVWFMIVYSQANEAVGFATAIAWCVAPFIIPDLVKLGIAMILVKRIPVVPGRGKESTG